MMNYFKSLSSTLIIAAFLIGCNSENKKKEDNQSETNLTQADKSLPEGVQSEVLKTLKISDIIIPEGNKPLECRSMRFRRFRVTPGGEIGLHSHENRPAILSVIQGEGMNVFAYSADEKQAATPTTVKYGQSYSELGAIHYAVNLSKTDTLQLVTFDLLDNNSECNGVKYPQHTRILDKLKKENNRFYVNAPKSEEDEFNIPIYDTPLSDIHFKEGSAGLKDRIYRSRKFTLSGGAALPPQDFENRPTYIIVLKGAIEIKYNNSDNETITKLKTAKLINHQGEVTIRNKSANDEAVYLVMEIWDPADKDIL